MIKEHLLRSKTKNELERDFNNAENYFLTTLTGDLSNNISCYSLEFMNNLDQFNKSTNKDFDLMRKSFIRIILEKSISKFYTINEIQNYVKNISNNLNYSLKLLEIKEKSLKELLKKQEINKSEFNSFLSQNKQSITQLKKIYQSPKVLTKELKLYKESTIIKTKKSFNIDLNNILTNDYFILMGRLNEQICKLNNESDFIDIDKDIDFFHNCSNYIIFFDGFNFIGFDELINILCDNNLLIQEKYKDNLFLGFYLVYLKDLLISNKNYNNNYNLFYNNFKNKFIQYYSENLFNQIENRFNKWNEFLNIYNESLNKVNSETSWGLILFLAKEFVLEVNRLNLLIFKMFLDPLKIDKLK